MLLYYLSNWPETSSKQWRPSSSKGITENVFRKKLPPRPLPTRQVWELCWQLAWVNCTCCWLTYFIFPAGNNLGSKASFSFLSLKLEFFTRMFVLTDQVHQSSAGILRSRFSTKTEPVQMQKRSKFINVGSTGVSYITCGLETSWQFQAWWCRTTGILWDHQPSQSRASWRGGSHPSSSSSFCKL